MVAKCILQYFWPTGSNLQYFFPALSDYPSRYLLLGLLLSGHLRQQYNQSAVWQIVKVKDIINNQSAVWQIVKANEIINSQSEAWQI